MLDSLITTQTTLKHHGHAMEKNINALQVVKQTKSQVFASIDKCYLLTFYFDAVVLI